MSPEVYAITNVPPQTQAFALAKVSRASGSCRDWIMKLNAEKSEKFFDQYYKDNPYGHASIGDLGHVAIAIEGVSQWVAHALELPWFGAWDGQELSTRFSSFAGKDCYCPDFNGNGEAKDLYHSVLDRLFTLYKSTADSMIDWYRRTYPRPESWSVERYESTVKARTFDVARYALPMAVKTAVMQVTSIRVLGRQISYCRSDEFPEVRAVGDQLISAVQCPSFDVAREHLLRSEIQDLLPSDLSDEVKAELLNSPLIHEAMRSLQKGILDKILPEQSVAATLVRHTDPNQYLIETRLRMRELASQLLPPHTPVQGSEEPKASLYTMYWLTPAQQTVAALLHWQASGHSFAVDWEMDMGALRDIHRQRRNISLPQFPNVSRGYVVPYPLRDAQLDVQYVSVMNGVQRDVRLLERLAGREAAVYAMPFAQVRSYAMFADLGQLDYITRLRANPNGRHFGYWQPAYDVAQQIIQTDPDNFEDFMGAIPMSEWDFYNRG